MSAPRPSSGLRGATWRRLVLLLLLPLVPAALSAWLHPRAPGWSALRAEAAEGAPGRLDVATARERHPDALWLDARSDEAYAAGHVPGALPLTEDAWEDRFAGLVEVWDGQRSLIVYCGGESCHASDAVARRLRRELGFENVFVLEGGWDAWSAVAGDEKEEGR